MATGALTRNVESASGLLAATTAAQGGVVLQLTNIHGDVALQLPLDPEDAPQVLDSDEYGNARDGQPSARYGWLGGNQRSSETLTGLTLMGQRVYNPTTGRFLSVDPVPAGSPNYYGYPADPITMVDLDGRGWSKVWSYYLRDSQAKKLIGPTTHLPPGRPTLPPAAGSRRPRGPSRTVRALSRFPSGVSPPHPCRTTT
ncbi:hypothetical protein LUR56_36280 [Streptomyces sp. MT29]|nr:hypothetical protein [Streptomyces sp. MT29]